MSVLELLAYILLIYVCKMCPFGTGSSAVSGKGENPKHTLKNCAKTAAEITVRQARELDKFQHGQRGYLEFYTNRARSPCSPSHRARSGLQWSIYC